MLIRRVVGSSMAPTLREGQIVIAKKSNYALFNIVIARVGSREVIKRIVALEPTITLKGDNINSSQYPDVVESDILGLVIWPRIKH